MGSRPKENPADKKARLRERRMSTLERARAAEDQAGGLTADLRAIYGSRRTVRPTTNPGLPPGMGSSRPSTGSSRPSVFGMYGSR